VVKKEKSYLIELNIKNSSGMIAFFTQLQLLDKNMKPVRPSFYTDNFFSLLPGESKHISIETFNLPTETDSYTVVVKSANVSPKQYTLSFNSKRTIK
jgi:hypothetical protein